MQKGKLFKAKGKCQSKIPNLRDRKNGSEFRTILTLDIIKLINLTATHNSCINLVFIFRRFLYH
jgi:hypothetical protein